MLKLVYDSECNDSAKLLVASNGDIVVLGDEIIQNGIVWRPVIN